MKLLRRILIRFLSIIYFLMSIIGFLGYFNLEDYSTKFFYFFSLVFGKYAIALPIICFIFAVIFWFMSRPPKKEKKTKNKELTSENKVPAYSQENSKQVLSKGTSSPNGFAAYFAQKLPITEQTELDKTTYKNLGTNFSTYFGQGKKNIYIPANTVNVQGFRDYFRDRTMKVAEYEQAANDTLGSQRQIEREPKVLSKVNTATEIAFQHRESRIQAAATIDTDDINRSSKNWILPGIELLTPPVKEDSRVEQTNPKVLEDVLSNFGVNARVINICVGPMITRYELSPAPGTKISKIVNLADDIALALASRDIRIEAPIPGKAAVGIEVPRKKTRTVSFKEVIDSEVFSRSKGNLKIALGKDITDVPVIGELERMPHLLVAGATGSGKSVFINCLLCSLLLHTTPDEVRLLLIDPKMVELNQYNGIPHLVAPVVTDPKKAAKALKYIVSEMENRYEKFASNGVRDIDQYNRTTQKESLPYIVVVIDELADLMMVAPTEIEEAICRLAQMARAAGIHLVLATQRPSVNVITGLIKANIPSRISFAVSSQIDSRTILDAMGAEKLLGRGDMLYAPIGLNKPARVHGCFIDENEIINIIDHWKRQGKTAFLLNEDQLDDSSSEEKNGEELDDRFVEAGKLVITTGIASVSYLQRRLRVGYSRAARLMDMLEGAGVVGRSDGNKPRDILMSLEVFNNISAK